MRRLESVYLCCNKKKLRKRILSVIRIYVDENRVFLNIFKVIW